MFAAPALGPMLSGFAVVVENWRWSLWEILWLAGPVFILWFFCLPETSASNILLRRSMRLRKFSQNPNLSSQSQIDRRGLTAGALASDAMIKPFEIMFKDPAVLFTNVYTALIYGIYYSFFEVFPLVYGPLYGFNLGETGVVFISIIVGCVLAIGIYFYYIRYMLIPDILQNGLRAQESRLRPALIFIWGPVIGLFIFGKLHPTLRYVVLLFANRMDARRVVREQERALDCYRHWHHNICPGMLHHHAVSVRLYPNVIPAVRRFALRRQRLVSLRFRFRGHTLCEVHVSQLGHRQRHQPTGRPEYVGRGKLRSCLWRFSADD